MLTEIDAIISVCQFWIASNGTHTIMLLNRRQVGQGIEFWANGNLIGSTISSRSATSMFQGIHGFWILPLNSGPSDEFLPHKKRVRKLEVHVSYEEHKNVQLEETKPHQHCCVLV